MPTVRDHVGIFTEAVVDGYLQLQHQSQCLHFICQFSARTQCPRITMFGGFYLMWSAETDYLRLCIYM